MGIRKKGRRRVQRGWLPHQSVKPRAATRGFTDRRLSKLLPARAPYASHHFPLGALRITLVPQ